MTVKEFYEFCKEKGIEDYEIEIQYRDGDGCYKGTDYLNENDIEFDEKNAVIVI